MLLVKVLHTYSGQKFLIVRNPLNDLPFCSVLQPRRHVNQFYPNLFARAPFLASKNNHGSLHPCSRKCRVSGLQVFKIKNLHLRSDFRQLRIHTSSSPNDALHDLTLFKMSFDACVQGVLNQIF